MNANKKIWIGIGVTVALLLIAGGIVWAFTKNRRSAATQNTGKKQIPADVSKLTQARHVSSEELENLKV